MKFVAGTPPKLAAVAPVKCPPRIVTTDPVPAVLGVTEVMNGVATHVKPEREANPPVETTETTPVVPPATTAVICVGETTVKPDAFVPPKLTPDAPVKFVPVIVTVMPVPALAGVNPEMVGGGRKVKPAKLVVPPAVITVILPLVAFAGTTAFICVAETIIKLAAFTPLNCTCVAVPKFVPIIVTVAPDAAAVGKKLVMVGVPANIKPGIVAMPPEVVTLTFPLAPAAGRAMI